MVNLRKRLLSLCLGLALSIGVGTGLSGTRGEATGVRAASTTYEKVSSLTAGDSVLIVSLYDSKTYYMLTDGSASKAPTATKVTVSDSKTTGKYDSYLFTVEADGTNWKFKRGSDYLYTSGNNNNLRVGSGNNIASTYKVTYVTSGYKMENVSKSGRYVGIYNDADWRTYNSATADNYKGSRQLINFYKPAQSKIEAYVDGNDSVNVNEEYTASVKTSDGTATTVSDVTYAFTASDGAIISTSDTSAGTFTASSAGKVTINASKDGYEITSKTVIVNSTDPYINLTLKSGATAYTGEEVEITSEYGNGVTGLTWTVEGGTISDIISSDTGFKGTLTSAGSIFIKATDTGNQVSSQVTIIVTQSEVTSITLDKSSISLAKEETTTLTATIVKVGTVSDDVTWSIDDSSIATISSTSGSTITITAIEMGSTNITATTSDGKTATCSVTVALMYTYTFGTTSSSNSFNDIDTTYEISPACFSSESTLYGTKGNCIRMSTRSAVGSFTYTLPIEGTYITEIVVSVKAWSATESTSLSVTPQDGTAITKTISDSTKFADYSYTIPSDGQYKSVTFSSSKRCYVSELKVKYAYKPVELAADATSLEIHQGKTHDLTLTASNFAGDPTFAHSITSGSDSISSIEFTTVGNESVATITASNTIGTAVIRFTATLGSNSAYVDVTVNVIESKTLTGLEIVTPGKSTFTEGDALTVEGLVVKATFDNGSTTEYSEANSNLGLLSFLPELGSALVTTEADVMVYVTAYGEDITADYPITVNAKPYASKVTNVEDLWDGQQVYIGKKDATSVATTHSGGNNLSSVTGVFDNTKGLSINDSTGAQAYTIGRLKIDNSIYYTFFDGKYYLTDAGNSSNNYLQRTEKIADSSSNCVYFTITINSSTGEATINSKSNTSKPSFKWNNTIISCYKSDNTYVNPVLYAVNSYNTTKVADSFAENRLYMSTYASEQGWCKDKDHHYYADAKMVWNAMSDDEKIELSENEDAYARLQAWAKANGDELDSDMNLVTSRTNTIYKIKDNSTSITIAVIVAFISLTAIGGCFFLRKKKEN